MSVGSPSQIVHNLGARFVPIFTLLITISLQEIQTGYYLLTHVSRKDPCLQSTTVHMSRRAQ
ncbi:hypothetical protein ES703_14880 [subsurface metagenome]